MLSPGYLPTIPSLLRSSRSPLIHRDLSWLQFNERVLDEARATGNPILERVKFLAITSSNLDEFFMIRVPSLERSLLYRLRGLDVQKARQIRRIRNSILESVSKFGAKQEETLDSLINELAQYQIILSHMNPWRDEAVELGRKIFQEKILPYLSIPETFRPSDVLTLDNAQAGAVFSERLWMKIPRTLPTLYFEDLGPDRPFYAFFLDDLLIRFLPESFSTQLELGLIRLTRDGDVALDVDHPDPESIPDHIVTRLGTRERGRPIRIQYSRGVSSKLAASLLEVTKLARPFAFQAPGTLYLHGLWSLVRQVPDRIARAHSTIQYPPLDSRVPRVFEDSSTIFEKIRGRDYLLHHPYDSFDAFVNWMKVASEDPHVVNIELTVYRMDALSPVITHLKNAAATKRVRVLIELRARFDELNNIRLADELRKAGVEVGYGFGKLKLHAKVALVTRKEKDGLVRYTHLSTGNYNAATARQYTDLAVLTANAEMGADARLFFDSVWEGKVPSNFKHLLVAPTRLSRRLQSLIQQEAEAAARGEKARIVAKVNALVDEGIAQSLYRASAAGVQIDLIVRGACSIIPGVKGLSENIRVVSIVDRFLEHSRIYYFGASKKMYLSSADWMPRNFFSRLEIAFPVLDERIYRYLEQVVMPAYLGDVAQARELTPQGTWRRRNRGTLPNPMRSQVLFRELALRNYQGTPLE